MVDIHRICHRICNSICTIKVIRLSIFATILIALAVSPWILRGSIDRGVNGIDNRDIYMRELAGDKLRIADAATGILKMHIYNKNLNQICYILGPSPTTSKKWMESNSILCLAVIPAIPIGRKRKKGYNQDEANEILESIADFLDQPYRFQILKALKPGAKTFKELLEETKIRRTTLDNYLKSLYFSGFVDKTAEHPTKYSWSKLLIDFFSLADEYCSNNNTPGS